MEAYSFFGEGTEVNERTPKGISEVPRKTSIVKLFDPLISLKSDTAGNFCRASLLKSNQENRDVTHLERANLDILENESLYTLDVPVNLDKPLIPVKTYTEEEFCKIIKGQEFFIQKEISKKLYDYEAATIECVENRERELTQLTAKSKRYNLLLSEVFIVLDEQKNRFKNFEEKLEKLNMETEMLKENIKTAKEDLNNAENAFSEIHSRYETSKGMIKCYKENIELLNQNFKEMQQDLDKHTDQYKMLESCTHDLVNKARIEAGKAKKTTENEIVCLTAQLKRQQIRMSNLEDEFLQARLTNDKLNILYKDLIAKLRV